MNPFVSLCTPTYNRRPFIPILLQCILSQTYPQEQMEWVILDDGEDKIKDLVEGYDFIKYYPIEKMNLGEKRNLLHKYTKGDVLIYMDDDDYYPPQRVEHSVNMLRVNPTFLCAGSSIMYIYFNDVDKIFQFGPYGQYHATAATFAFKRELLNQTGYEDKALFAEERFFLKKYTIPLVQMEPKKTILVITDGNNTVDRKKLITPPFVKETELTLEDFIQDPLLCQFYRSEINDVLFKYQEDTLMNM